MTGLAGLCAECSWFLLTSEPGYELLPGDELAGD